MKGHGKRWSNAVGMQCHRAEESLPGTRSKEPVEVEMAGGQNHQDALAAEAGHQVRLVVEQRGIDVVVAARGPDGDKLQEVDSPNGAQGPEELVFTPTISGNSGSRYAL